VECIIKPRIFKPYFIIITAKIIAETAIVDNTSIDVDIIIAVLSPTIIEETTDKEHNAIIVRAALVFISPFLIRFENKARGEK
jgi:hypothetical protein